MAYNIYQSRFKKLPNTKPNTFKILPKWQNFAKSGHTDQILGYNSKVVGFSLNSNRRDQREKKKYGQKANQRSRQGQRSR